MSTCNKRQSGERRELIKSEQTDTMRDCIERFESVIRSLKNRPSVVYIYWSVKESIWKFI